MHWCRGCVGMTDITINCIIVFLLDFMAVRVARSRISCVVTWRVLDIGGAMKTFRVAVLALDACNIAVVT